MADSKGRSHVVYQAMASGAVGLGGTVASLAMGYTSPALPSMRQDPHLHITPDQESWVGAVMPACALVGSVLAAPLVDNLGRRATLMLLSLPFAASWAMIATASSVVGVVGGRMVGGLCVGVQAVAGSVYMPEVVQLDLRNVMAFFPAVLGNVGLLMSFAAGQYLGWRGLAWVGAALCAPIMLLMMPLPETPHHLTRIGRKGDSLKALEQLRESKAVADKEQDEIDSALSTQQSESGVSMMEVFRPPNAWPVWVAIGLMLGQQTTGINAVIFYASSILESGGGVDGGTASVLLGAVNFVGTFVGMFAMALCRRRALMASSTLATLASLASLTAFFWAREAGYEDLAARMWYVPVLALVVYLLGFALGWGPVPWVFLGEGLPTAVRGTAVALVVGVNWASAFLVTKTFSWAVAELGAHVIFATYAGVTGVAAAVILQHMPETFQLSSAQVDQLYVQAATKKDQ